MRSNNDDETQQRSTHSSKKTQPQHATSTNNQQPPSIPADQATERALVIGAGPSGLVTAKYLLESRNPRYDVTIMESQPQNLGIGGSFVNKVYDGTRLVSSKYITAFSDFRMVGRRRNGSGGSPDVDDEKFCHPIDHTNHPSADDYVKYLEAYCRRFGIMSVIRFGCKVLSVTNCDTPNKGVDGVHDGKVDSTGYNIQYQEESKSSSAVKTEHFDIVAVCSGLHNVPHIPSIFASLLSSKVTNSTKNTSTPFRGTILHSSQYKDPSIFDNQRVLVLGSGETAMDIALRAIRNPHCQSVALNVRRGFLSIPHNLAEDRPLDVFITNLFEHAYEHPYVQKYHLRYHLSTAVIRLFLFLTGSSIGFNQWACGTEPIQRGYHIINKSHDAMSHLNVPIKSKYMYWGRFWMWVYGETDLRPIHSFHRTSVVQVGGKEGKTVMFDDGSNYEADVIVMATGYKQSFPFLSPEIQKDHGREATKAATTHVVNGPGDETVMIETKSDTDNMQKDFFLQEDYLPSEHFITSKKRPRLSFIGFVRPNVGAIPPMSELQVMWWLCRMKDQITKPKCVPKIPHHNTPKPSYMLLGGKYPYGVDYGNYMHRVAEDMDAAPTLSHLLTNSQHPFRALYTYCMGQAHIPLFRLRGPFASSICESVVVEELWDVCLKRGLVENFGLVMVCILSLVMNVMACVVEIIMCLFITRDLPKFFTRYY